MRFEVKSESLVQVAYADKPNSAVLEVPLLAQSDRDERPSNSNSNSNLKHAREAVGTQNPLGQAYPEQASADRPAISSHPSLAKLHQSGKSASGETTLSAWEEIEKAEMVKLKSKGKKKSLMENRPSKDGAMECMGLWFLQGYGNPCDQGGMCWQGVGKCSSLASVVVCGKCSCYKCSGAATWQRSGGSLSSFCCHGSAAIMGQHVVLTNCIWSIYPQAACLLLVLAVHTESCCHSSWALVNAIKLEQFQLGPRCCWAYPSSRPFCSCTFSCDTTSWCLCAVGLCCQCSYIVVFAACAQLPVHCSVVMLCVAMESCSGVCHISMEYVFLALLWLYDVVFKGQFSVVLLL
ncbi:hypothetical protein U1Q18_019321 [Sarracenia purpurea var. burkii]